MIVTVIPIVIVALGTVTKRFDTEPGGLENKRMSGYHPDYSITEIGQNTKKSPGDLRGLIVSQTPVKKKKSSNAGVKN